MNLTIGKKMGLGFGVTLSLMAILAAVVLFHLSNMQERFSYVIKHDAPVIANARHLLTLVVDMETGQRGFVITGNEEFLDPYENARNSFADILAEEKRLVSNNPPQVKRLESIEDALAQWHTKAALPEIEMRRKILAAKVGARQLQEILGKGVGKEYLDQIRVVTCDMGENFLIDGNMQAVFLLKCIQKSMVDQETGERGFLITGKEEFLEPFVAGQTELTQALAKLQELLHNAHDCGVTESDINELHRLHGKWLSTVAEPKIEIRKQLNARGELASDIKDRLSEDNTKTILKQLKSVVNTLSERFRIAGNEKLLAFSEEVGKALVEQESELRAYLSLGQDEYLQKYKNAWKRWTQQVAGMQNLNNQTYDRVIMQRRYNRLGALATDWLQWAATPEIAVRRKMNKHPESLGDLARMLELGTGKKILDEIRAEFKLFTEEEEVSMAKRFASATAAAISTKNITYGLSIVSLVLGAVIAFQITLGITNPLHKLASALYKVSDGDLDQKLLSQSNDEIGDLSRSFDQMVQNLRHLDNERENNANQLQKTNNNLEKDAARKDAMARLADTMHNTNNLTEFCNEALAFLAQYSESAIGSLHVLEVTDSEPDCLSLIGTYAYEQHDSITTQVASNGNLVGQVAFERKSNLITDLPEDYVRVSSGLGSAVPRNLLVIPLVQGGKLGGVVELGFFESQSDEQITTLEAMGEFIAGQIFTLQGIHKIDRLYQETQHQADALQIANIELEEKSLALEFQKQKIESRNTDLVTVREKLEKNALELKKSSKYKSDFLANMSHEIRTPMTAILGFADIVLNNVNNPENIDGLKTIKRNGQYLLGIINDILDLSKIEAGKIEVERIKCSPCQLLADVASLMRVRAQSKGLALEVTYEGSIPQHIYSDPTRLRQVLINLVGNAVKFTEVGKIRISARMLDTDTPEPKMQFDIIDTGIGMTEEQIEKLFQPFVQADTSTTRKFGGTGLGLTISKRFAEMLGGDINATSVPGEGSTFTATVLTGPIENVQMLDKPSEADGSNLQVEKQTREVIKLNCRLLLAEDGPDNQRLISFILRKAGAEVAIAENGQVAHDLALEARNEGKPFDVILMDMQMPVLDGYEATGKLRDAGYTHPIIALTAHAMNSDREKCLNSGCNDYTTKPIIKNKLISMIAHHAAQASVAESV